MDLEDGTLSFTKPQFVKIGKLDDDNNIQIWQQDYEQPEEPPKREQILAMEENRRFKGLSESVSKLAKSQIRSEAPNVQWAEKITYKVFKKR